MSSTDSIHDFNDPNNLSDPHDSPAAHGPEPTTWVSLIWRLTKDRPTFWMFALFLVYFGLRIFTNVDPLDQVVDAMKQQVHVVAYVPLPDLSGKWNYQSEDKLSKKRWGGTVTIKISRDGKVEKISVQGARTWEGIPGESESKQWLPFPIPWTANGRAYANDDRIVEWLYSTQEDQDHKKQGLFYVTAEKIAANEGNKLIGEFSDLFEKEPRYGVTMLTKNDT